MSKIREVSDILCKLGVRSSLLGYGYLRDSILLVLETPGMNPKAITKEIYPAIANKYNTTPSRVERAMRHSISDVQPYNGFKAEVFPYLGLRDGITNKEFIYGIANYVHMLFCDEEKRGA